MVKNDVNDYKFPVVVIGVSVLIAMVLLVFVGRPLWNGMQQKRKELKERQAVLTALEIKLENLKGLAAREEELKQKNAKVLAALPSDKDMSRLFVQFEKVAVSNGVTVKNVTESSANTAETGAIKRLSYEVNGDSSSYASLRSAIDKFNNALRILSIDGFEASKAAEKGKALTTKFTIVTFARGTE